MHGQGTKFYYHNGSAFVQIAKLMEFEHPEYSRGSVEQTPLDVAPGTYKTFEPAQTVDPGEMTVNFILEPSETGQLALLAQLKEAGNKQYKIELPDTGTTHGTETVFIGHVTGWGAAIQGDEDMMRPVKIKLSGEPVTTAPD